MADTPEPVYGTASVSLCNALALTPAEVDALPVYVPEFLISLLRLADSGGTRE